MYWISGSLVLGSDYAVLKCIIEFKAILGSRFLLPASSPKARPRHAKTKPPAFYRGSKDYILKTAVAPN